MKSNRDAILRSIREETKDIDFSIPESSRLPAVETLLSRELLRGGKKLRPYVCLCFGRMLAVPRPQLEACSKIAEIVHAASLAHDDVIDEAHLRRGRRTLNATTSNSEAVLAGDLLLARATTLCLQLGDINLIRDLSETLEELVAGEWLQLEAHGNLEVGARHLERVSSAKTASLLRWCFLAPLRLAGLRGEIEILSRELARLLGLAFQMTDDCIDYSESSGKDYGKDFSEGLVNWVTWTLISEHHKSADPQQAHGWSTHDIQIAVEEVQKRSSIKLRMANVCLEQIAATARRSGIAVDTEAHEKLSELIQALEKRSL